jgi:hypothetical protein
MKFPDRQYIYEAIRTNKRLWVIDLYIYMYIYKSNFLVTINNSLKVTGKIDFMNDSNKIKYPRINLILMM